MTFGNIGVFFRDPPKTKTNAGFLSFWFSCHPPKKNKKTKNGEKQHIGQQPMPCISAGSWGRAAQRWDSLPRLSACQSLLSGQERHGPPSCGRAATEASLAWLFFRKPGGQTDQSMNLCTFAAREHLPLPGVGHRAGSLIKGRRRRLLIARLCKAFLQRRVHIASVLSLVLWPVI